MYIAHEMQTMSMYTTLNLARLDAYSLKFENLNCRSFMLVIFSLSYLRYYLMLSFNVELVKSARECFDRQILVRLYDTDAQVFAGKKHLLSVFSSLS